MRVSFAFTITFLCSRRVLVGGRGVGAGGEEGGALLHFGHGRYKDRTLRARHSRAV